MSIGIMALLLTINSSCNRELQMCAKEYQKPVPIIPAQTLCGYFQMKAHMSPHLIHVSTVWDGCSDILFQKINSRHRRAAKLMLPDSSLTTKAKL